MRFYNWSRDGGADDPGLPVGGYLSIHLGNLQPWELRAGRYIQNWDPETTAIYDEAGECPDFPFASDLLPVYSPRLRAVMEDLRVDGIQYLPLRIRGQISGREIPGYCLVNYLHLIDGLDRERSSYQFWTKENLLFWEKRPSMLGTFRDVKKPVLVASRIRDFQVFRLWGWSVMVVVREDVKNAIEAAAITGCWFTEIGTSSSTRILD
jgi:Immunity protein family (Imm11)